ncbi:lysyl-tRNA synthetase class 2 [Hydrogenivirga caldilitoris]|uniref:Lysyl-tRNA synthetase class 2 n=1 Tax=Hydrogenivirga caldilitoris TaxID=246264 RepID=A0A497XNE4_9AQUI|nr:elongation factor P--(R)-beta-lysine ligase [Hydrogenivirga caldilitoris]RLJ70486.1 lysyl-tRNA synthetase class 2 [Hydrogenivirga caldilitoris]
MVLDKWSEFIDKLREFFKKRGYLEVFTPALLDYPNLDANVEPIPVKVKRQGTERTMWLQTSPEYSMKKLLSKYRRDMFQIAKVFRNNEHGRLHRVEFHMLEWYKTGESYEYLIEEIKELLNELFGYTEFEELTLDESFKRHLGFNLLQDKESLQEALKERAIYYEEDEDWETLFYRAFVEVERRLGRGKPIFIKDFPPQLSALAKVRNEVAERFELFIEGVELANGWTEETNPEEIRRRLQREALKRDLPVDEEFIEAHRTIPDCAGCSIGVDRLFMLYLGKSSLDDIELFKL